MKFENGLSDVNWIGETRRFCGKMLSGDRYSINVDKMRQIAPSALKILGAIFSIIGLAATFRWSITSETNEATETVCTTSSTEGCPWQLVFSDLANRLQLLEMAFKEQVVARETIEKEVNNQSDVNSLLEKKLIEFVERLQEMNSKYRELEARFDEISSRLHSDESLGFLIIMMIVIEIMVKIHPRVHQLNPWRKQKEPRDNRKEEKEAPSIPKNGVNYSPKHGLSLKCELCVVLFKKENNNIVSTLVDAILKHLDDAKLAVKPHYTVESHESLRHLPRVKLFLVVSEMEEKSGQSFLRHQDCELHTSAVRFMKSLGAQIVLVMANDEGSKKLTAHSMYNTSLRLVQSHEVLQELASNGRVFSMWRELTSHQLSHLRKIIKTVLNIKPNVR